MQVLYDLDLGLLNRHPRHHWSTMWNLSMLDLTEQPMLVEPITGHTAQSQVSILIST